MHDFVPQLCVLNNEPGARRQQQLRIHAYLFGGLAVRQAGVFYRVSSGSRNPRCQNLDMLIHITASLAPQPAQQASLCLAAQPAKLAARNSHQNHIRTAMDIRSRMTEWCTTRSIAAMVVIGSLKMRFQSEKTRFVEMATLRLSYRSACKVNSTSISSRSCWT